MNKVSNKEIIVWAMILGLAGLIIYTGMFDKHESPLLGQQAPALVLKDEKGAVTDLDKLRGSVVVLNVYATWCPPCRREIPEFAQYYRRIETDPSVKLYGVVFESGAPAKAAKMSRAMGVTYPILMGDASMTEQFHLHTYPTTIVIDAHGIVRSQIVGAIGYSDLEKLVADAMVPRSPAPPPT